MRSSLLEYYERNRQQGGFTLIEVLIALVIAGIGIVAILQLQGVFLQTASDSQKRAMATAIAEKKFEEWRGFESVSSSASGSVFSYYDIVSGTDSETVQNGSVAYDFDLTWNVTPYLVSAGTPSITSAAYSDFKNVTLMVSWDDGAQSLSLSSLIGEINPGVSDFIEKSGLGGERPEVDYTPGGVPDVVPIDVGNGEVRETSKPLPDVDQSDDSTEVRFTTVTYDTNDYKQVDAEDFVTVNCFCELNTTPTDGVTPYHHIYISSAKQLGVSAGNIVNNVQSGTPDDGYSQSRFCTTCCSQHHDSPTYDYTGNGVPRYDNTVTSGAHKHYKFDPDLLDPTDPDYDPTALVEAQNSETYMEACRFRRVDGIFRLFPDWEMLDLNIMPYNYLASSASSSLASYQQYVADIIQDEIFSSTIATPLLGRDFNTTDAVATQLLSRGIYVDDMSYDANWVDYIINTVAASSALLSSQDWLRYVPFYEINMTLLTIWESGDDTVATVTSENIDTIDEDNDYYGVYSRGLVVGGSTVGASTAITAYSKTDNSGLLGNTYSEASAYTGYDNRIRPDVLEQVSSLAVSIIDPGSQIAIQGQIVKAGGKQLSKVTVTIELGTCDAPIISGDTASYNCYVPQNAGVVKITPNCSQNNEYLDTAITVGGPVTAVTQGTDDANDATISVSVGTSGITGMDFQLKSE